MTAIISEDEESILTPVQLLWVNLIMDSFGALALATDPASSTVLQRKPESRNGSLVSLTSWKMIIGQAIYQLVVVNVLDFAGMKLLGYSSPEQEDTLHTLVFNVFVWMQLFNLYK